MLPSNVIKSWALEKKVLLITYALPCAIGARAGHMRLPTPPPVLNWEGICTKRKSKQLAQAAAAHVEIKLWLCNRPALQTNGDMYAT